MKRVLMMVGLLVVALIASPALAADGKALVKSNKCGSCHKMSGPAVKTIAEVMKRKAPDLFYAGSKFNKEWLVGYIQNPIELRPGGTVYSNHIKTEGDQDVVTGLIKCGAKLSAGDAAAVADYLMTLKDSSMKTGVFKKGKVKKARAKKLMKTEACNACHKITKIKEGGVSCPTLEGAGVRMNPDWMYSFIQNPQHWDPKVWMAKGSLDDAKLQLIVNYLVKY